MMHATTTKLHGATTVAVARARYVGASVANDLMAEGSWSIPCTSPATFHKPRPRRSPETSS
jgi:hypothetical protein